MEMGFAIYITYCIKFLILVFLKKLLYDLSVYGLSCKSRRQPYEGDEYKYYKSATAT